MKVDYSEIRARTTDELLKDLVVYSLQKERAIRATFDAHRHEDLMRTAVRAILCELVERGAATERVLELG